MVRISGKTDAHCFQNKWYCHVSISGELKYQSLGTVTRKLSERKGSGAFK